MLLQRLLQVTGEADVKISLTHTTPVHHYVDDITFTLAAGSAADSCNVHVSTNVYVFACTSFEKFVLKLH